MANPFKKRLTLDSVIAPLTKVTADLEALKAQNAADVTDKESQIAALQTEVKGHKEEAANADAVLANINALLKPVATS
jgi:hypothetical protein